MEGPDGSPPQSLCMIRAAEFFPKPQMEKEDTQLTVPFQELAGESVKYLGRTDDGVLALSNYRIFLLKCSTNSETSVPLGLIESTQTRDLFHLIINCKDASTVKCSFETAEQCSEWQRRIQLSIGVPDKLESLFAFPFCSWLCDSMATQNGNRSGMMDGCIGNIGVGIGAGGLGSVGGLTDDGMDNLHLFGGSMPDYSERLQRTARNEDDFEREVERLGFDLKGMWRTSHANEEFSLCPSYPKKLLVPSCITDDMLRHVANFRGSKRLPVVVWRHRKSGAVIARCSQPEVGWLGWRNAKDEDLLKALADACAYDRGEQMRRITQAGTSYPSTTMTSGESSPSSPDGSHEEVALDEVRKILIVDARSYTSAVTNRARGGGCECIDYYPCAEIEFMNLGNIHAIRKSFHALRQLCASPPDVPNWLGLLEKTMWLQHLSGLLAASMTVCHAIEKKGRPVLVHCSDGWDRTPQIVATAELCLDPFYRTVEGFRILVEREWLSFGHKFADRCGHGPSSDELNERCPVFLQWLDLVHQIHKQFPCSFEFSMAYLIKLAQHSHSCLFGTFLCNTYKERLDNFVFERTFSVWPFLSGPMYRNPLYVANKEKVLWPAHNVRDLCLWTEVYLGSLGNQNSIDFPSGHMDGIHGSMSPMAKTRSYGDLISAGITQNGISRRSSDPNMTVDPSLTMGSNSENNSIADLQSEQSEREDSPDIANQFHDTTKEVENLTNKLKNHDYEDFKCFPLNYDLKTNDINDDCKDAFMPRALFQTRQQQRRSADGQEQRVNGGEPLVIMTKNGSTTFFSSPKSNEASENPNQIGCEVDAVTSSLNLTNCNVSSNLPDEITIENKLNGCLLNGSTTNNDDDDGGNNSSSDNTKSGNIMVHKTGDIDINLMESVDLSDMSCNLLSANNGSADGPENIWYGSINTSTDTLVPIENVKQQAPSANKMFVENERDGERTDLTCDVPDGVNIIMAKSDVGDTLKASQLDFLKEERKFNDSNNIGIPNVNNSSTNCGILPMVHTTSRPNILSNSSSNASISSTSSSLNNLNKACNHNHNTNNNNNNNNSNSNVSCSPTNIQNNCTGIGISNSDSNNSSSSCSCDNKIHPASPTQITANTSITLTTSHTRNTTNTSVSTYQANAECCESTATHPNPMEESILILPEHKKLEISVSGKYETVSNSSTGQATTLPTTTTAPSLYSYASNATAIALGSLQRRRRTSSSNSRRDGVTTRQMNGSTMSRFSLPGVRSLPMTPPGLPERPQIAISCPDGLAHALSEQNIRLQQIVHEHKLREDVLLREIHDMRMALLKKTCPNCNNATATNDEQCSVVDNVENTSICSWEAVEDRSGPSSCTSSSIQANATSVLWVPDYAVTRCTSCQTEFWIGRRKHHCRSCGQIFCADCSEFWAPLPDEKLFSPVRLCGPCYHSVTTRMQQQNRSYMGVGTNSNISTISTMNNNGSTSTSTTTVYSNINNAVGNSLLLTNAATTPVAVPLQQQQQQQQQLQYTATAAAASVAAAAAAAAATNTGTSNPTPIVVDSSLPHLLLGPNITASVAN